MTTGAADGSSATPVGGPPAGHDGPPICGATTRAGGACGQAAGWGTPHPGRGRCKLHLGSTAGHVTHAERQAEQEAIDTAKRTYGLPLDVDPGEALLGLVHRAAGVCAWLDGEVGRLDQVTRADKAHPLVALYLEERKHLAQVAKDALAARVDERRIRLAERQGQALVQVLELFAAALGHDPHAPEVRAAARQSLLTVDGQVVAA